MPENLSYIQKNWLETKNKLDSISPSMCLAKWCQATIYLHNGRTHSCHHPSTHKIPLEELKNNPSALHNTKFKKEQRAMMLKGNRPSECEYCWDIEDNSDKYSDRILKSNAPWARNDIDKVLKCGSTGNYNLSYVEINFGNICNFKCSYCQPDVSSMWMEEIKNQGSYPTSTNFNSLEWLKSQDKMPIPENQENPYVDAFWKWWPELYQNLNIIRVTGGEPLLNKNTFKLMEYLIENPKEIEFHINTNLCVPEKNMEKFLSLYDKLYDMEKKVFIYTSIDNFGKKAEYIRHGLNYGTWIGNFCNILEQYPKNNITIMCTFNVLSIFGFDKFLEIIKRLKWKYRNKYRAYPILLDISYLRYPLHQSIKILPFTYLENLEKNVQYIHQNLITHNRPDGFEEMEYQKISRIKDWFKSPSYNSDVKQNRIDFYKFFTEHDKRRNTNIIEVFPEIKEFWYHCKKLAGE